MIMMKWDFLKVLLILMNTQTSQYKPCPMKDTTTRNTVNTHARTQHGLVLWFHMLMNLETPISSYWSRLPVILAVRRDLFLCTPCHCLKAVGTSANHIPPSSQVHSRFSPSLTFTLVSLLPTSHPPTILHFTAPVLRFTPSCSSSPCRK